jgi:ubiquinone biosynthesis protein
LVLLQKTLLNIEGLGRQLYPQLNLWDTAQPYLENWVEERFSPQGMLRRLQRHAPSWMEQLPLLPDAVMDNLQHLREMDARAAQQQRELEMLKAAIEQRDQRRGRTLAGLLAMVAAVVMAVPEWAGRVADMPLPGWMLLIAGAFLLWPGKRNP